MEEPKIIYENENFLAVLKPAGLMVHGVKIAKGKERSGSVEPTLVDWLLKHRPEVGEVGDDVGMRPGIVHRLDKETSGIILVAKTQTYFEYLKSLFQNHIIKKTYYAIVEGIPKKKEGTINAPIGIVSGTLRRSIHSKKMAKEATTTYKVIKEFPDASLLEVHPVTGRTHQIRVHLASIGHPVIGDRLYGRRSKKDNAPSRLMLHAASIEFSDSDGSMIHLSTEVPFADGS